MNAKTEHSKDCGTQYRGCAPDCPKDIGEQTELVREICDEVWQQHVQRIHADIADRLYGKIGGQSLQIMDDEDEARITFEGPQVIDFPRVSTNKRVVVVMAPLATVVLKRK